MLKANTLTSCSNPRIKEIIKLREARHRKKSNLFIIEGYREFKLALAARSIVITELYYCPSLFHQGDENRILELSLDRAVSLFEVSEKVFAKIGYGDRREGLIAVAKEPDLSLEKLKLKANPLLVVVEKIEKPGNIGAILRTADAAGIDAVIVAGDNVDVYNPNTIRSSLGTIFSVPIAKAKTEEIVSYLKKHKVKIVSAYTQAELAYSSFDFRGGCAIVLGSEDKGLSRSWIENSDYKIRIPMVGRADSLNVSVTAAILLFEAVRQRGLNAPTGVSVS